MQEPELRGSTDFSSLSREWLCRRGGGASRALRAGAAEGGGGGKTRVSRAEPPAPPPRGRPSPGSRRHLRSLHGRRAGKSLRAAQRATRSSSAEASGPCACCSFPGVAGRGGAWRRGPPHLLSATPPAGLGAALIPARVPATSGQCGGVGWREAVPSPRKTDSQGAASALCSRHGSQARRGSQPVPATGGRSPGAARAPRRARVSVSSHVACERGTPEGRSRAP